ncbi:RusA family crossover junction endodeoxyribonuclease [Massilia sp. TWR1-2-2]|uniref:RusA family crossover junction endodeoxyribonuclease n=1 Tax=Massilia sp. TWR1-2-2 TaxID=2804584 RepID=UPI003CEADF08
MLTGATVPLIVDFLLPRRPVSHQAKDAATRNAWRDYVFGRAFQAWPARPLHDYRLKFTMVYLSEDPRPGDINNFVKPIQDALCTLVYADDSMILDVSAHMRYLSEPTAIRGLPRKLAQAVIDGQACVYVAISDSSALAEELK